MVDTGAPIYASSALLFVGSADIYMFFATGSDLLPASAPGGTGTFKLFGLKDNSPGAGATVKIQRDLATVTLSGGLANGERPSTSPSVAGDIVFYTTTVEAAGTPCADFTVEALCPDVQRRRRVRHRTTTARSRTTRARSSVRWREERRRRSSSISTCIWAQLVRTGAAVEAFGDPEDFNNGIGQVGVRILSWREIR